MKQLFLLDENLSPLLAEKMGKLGYNAKAVRNAILKGAEDTEIVKWAIKNKAVIITADLDFGELWYWNYYGEVGVVVLRVKAYNLESQYKVIKFLHDNDVLKKDIRNSLIVSTSNRYRIRQ
ncbi:DUF5615 family PIN-like protein [Candidatus Woesearchaeota archaeon]|nr:DUF5615 family PIN-like protein [Candidatus Woesearchaeota archaeon]